MQKPSGPGVDRPLRVLGTFFITILLLTAAACGRGGDVAESGQMRIAAQGVVDGELLVVDDLVGSDTVLWFWAPW